MASIPLTEIPNAPQSGNPAMQNVNIPSVNLGFAERAIKEGYQGQMVDMKAAAAPGYALQQVGNDMVNIGSLTTDTVRKVAEVADATATKQFLQNLDSVKNDIKMQQAGTDPAMYPVIVEQAFADKERLLQGVSGFGRQFVESDVIRAHTNARAEAGLAAYMGKREQEKGNNLVAMAGYMQRGEHGDADALNQAMFTSGDLSAREFASNALNIKTDLQTRTFLEIVHANPDEAQRLINQSLVSGKPIDGFENISDQTNLAKLSRITEAAGVFQAAERTDALSQLIDSYGIQTVPALEANPVFMGLANKPELQDALRSRLKDMKIGTTEAEVATKSATKLVESYPANGDKLVEEYARVHRQIIASVPSPFAESLIKKLDQKKDALAANAGQLPPDQDIERHASQILNAYEDGGVLGELPDNKEKGTPAYMQKTLAIQKRREDLMRKIREGNPATRADVENLISENLRPDEAKKAATDAGGSWSWLFGESPQDIKMAPEPMPSADEPLPELMPEPTPFKDATATAFGTNVDGSPDAQDPKPGKYAGDKTHDPKFMGASLSEAALKEEGIPVDQAGQFDVIVKTNNKVVRVPISDLGPHPDVEKANGRTIDLTGATHRFLGTNGKSKVTYRVVPRNYSE